MITKVDLHYFKKQREIDRASMSTTEIQINNEIIQLLINAGG